MSAASAPSQRFPRNVRLLRRADFQSVYECGRRHFSDSMTVFYLLRAVSASGEDGNVSDPGPRIGITVGRVLGKAVERGRIKRRIRNAVRLHLSSLSVPVDVVINPKRIVLKVEFTKLTDEMRRTFEVVNQKAKLPDMSGGRARRTKQ
ncbi:MAG TPA: ribonuclease P protein component [Terriglobales bacterium]